MQRYQVWSIWTIVLLLVILLTRYVQHKTTFSWLNKEHSDGIPKIIHQTWSSSDVPESMADWIRSWLHHNPDWEYWFWSDEEITTLLNARYPHLLSSFQQYEEGVKWGDALRYIALYEVGGIYADLDMECLKPWSDLLSNGQCFLTEENYEHLTLLFQRKDPLIINCVMACRARHPFYKATVDSLPKDSRLGPIKATGPLFFTKVFEGYKQKANVSFTDHLVVLPPRYLMPNRDRKARFNTKCQHIDAENMPIQPGYAPAYIHNPSLDKSQGDRYIEMCQMLRGLKFASTVYPESIATHHWAHTWLDNKDKYEKEATIPIKKLVPSVKFYSNILDGTQTSKFYEP